MSELGVVDRTTGLPSDQQQPQQHRRASFEDVTAEEGRRATFDAWPHRRPDAAAMARAGFFYYGLEDVAECFACHARLNAWRPDDDPRREHERLSPACPFVARLSTAASGDRAVGAVAAAPPSSPPLGRHFPNRPELAVFTERLRTFAEWPVGVPASAEGLARAGFAYVGVGDRCECYYCALALHNWEASDDPWVEHAFWSPHCNYVLHAKGARFVEEARKKRPELMKTDESAKDEDDDFDDDEGDAVDGPTSLDEATACKVCFVRPMSVCFSPCGHVACCARCGLAMAGCPVCRQSIGTTIPLNLV